MGNKFQSFGLENHRKVRLGSCSSAISLRFFGLYRHTRLGQSSSRCRLQYFYYSVFFMLLGIIAIASAIRYTVGKEAYGYKGYGDIFVFIFFGLLGVLGTFFLHTLSFEPITLVIAISLGCFSTAVLNINNIRDIASDTRAGKKTIPARFGKKKALIYHWFLLIGGMTAPLLYVAIQQKNTYWFLLSYPLFILNGLKLIVILISSLEKLIWLIQYCTLFLVLCGQTVHLRLLCSFQ